MAGSVVEGSAMRMTMSATLSASRSWASPGWLIESCPAPVPLPDPMPGAVDLATTEAATVCVPRFPRRCCNARATDTGRGVAATAVVRVAAGARRSMTAGLRTEARSSAMLSPASARAPQRFPGFSFTEGFLAAVFGSRCCLVSLCCSLSLSLHSSSRSCSSISTCGSRISTGRT